MKNRIFAVLAFALTCLVLGNLRAQCTPCELDGLDRFDAIVNQVANQVATFEGRRRDKISDPSIYRKDSWNITKEQYFNHDLPLNPPIYLPYSSYLLDKRSDLVNAIHSMSSEVPQQTLFFCENFVKEYTLMIYEDKFMGQSIKSFNIQRFLNYHIALLAYKNEYYRQKMRCQIDSLYEKVSHTSDSLNIINSKVDAILWNIAIIKSNCGKEGTSGQDPHPNIPPRASDNTKCNCLHVDPQPQSWLDAEIQLCNQADFYRKTWLWIILQRRKTYEGKNQILGTLPEGRQKVRYLKKIASDELSRRRRRISEYINSMPR